MERVIIIGCGAAGMMAGISAAEEGHVVTIYDKNDKPGKKIYITGKGRCNITNACDTEDLFENIISNRRFMYSSIYSFSNYDVIKFFDKNGCPTKIERGNRVFPTSDKSSDVIKTLYKRLLELNVNIVFNSNVKDIIIKEDKFHGIVVENKNSKCQEINGDKLIIATGGLAYPSTGSTGDGYSFAKKMGHNIIDLSPSLVPINIKGLDCKDLQGLSLKNVKLNIFNNNKKIYSELGEMLFTHFGISGPLVLTGSCYILDSIKKNKSNNFRMNIDLKPAITIETLDKRIIKEFKENQNKDFRNSLDGLLPKKIISVIIERSKINPYKKVNNITKEERSLLVNIIKSFELDYAGLRNYNEAVITRGGIDVKQINPSTMESKIIKNVYFAGEVIDVDGFTGGFNLQIAWSTGFLAGKIQ